MSNLDELLTVEDLSVEIHTSVDGIYRLNRLGSGPPRMRVGRRVLYRRGDVLDWLRTRYVDPSAAPRAVA